MPTFEILKPLDAAVGKRRLLGELKNDLDSDDYSEFRWLVAYAKAGPLQRLKSRLQAWRAKGRSIRAIFGIDQQGTSKEALEIALAVCDEVFITQERDITFHPKAYIFTGAAKARLYLGSNNLTVGGTETNFEAAVVVEASLPSDNAVLIEINDLWDQLLPANCPSTKKLDQALLNKLIADGYVLDERLLHKKRQNATGKKKPRSPKSGLILQPPSPLPKGTVKPPAVVAASGQHPATSLVAGHVLHIRPHGNGEIHLSTMAANEDPSFFGLPFTGLTQPKKSSNKPYYFRDPRPLVDINVYGANLTLVSSLSDHPLYMVHYTSNGEIRITSRAISDHAPQMSILIMRPATRAGLTYELTVHTPQSPEYGKWTSVCQTPMPGGRHYGWF
ncbi:MAG: hypothetical protein ACXW27_12290 [Allosphingosinicella sp.]